MKRGVLPGLVLVLLGACTDDVAPTSGQQADRVQTPVERGLALAKTNACTACHALDGTRGIGPSWAGIYGTLRTFADGTTALADESYLRRAMLEPAAQVVEGFDSVMVPAPVTEAQLLDIIALIKELEDGPLPP